VVVADKRQTRRAGSEYAQDYHGAQHGNSGIVIDDGVAAAGMKSHALWPTGVVALNPGYEPASFPYHPGGGSVATEVSDEIYDDVRFRPRSSTTVSPAAAEVKLVLHVSKFALQPRIVTLFPSTQFHLDLTTFIKLNSIIYPIPTRKHVPTTSAAIVARCACVYHMHSAFSLAVSG